MGRVSRRPSAVIPLALCALAGCAQIFGIDQTSGAEGVKLTIQRRSIGATIVDSPQDLSMNTASWLIADDGDPTGLTRVPAELADVDTWRAVIRNATPPIQFDLPDFPKPPVPQFDFPNA